MPRRASRCPDPRLLLCLAPFLLACLAFIPTACASISPTAAYAAANSGGGALAADDAGRVYYFYRTPLAPDGLDLCRAIYSVDIFTFLSPLPFVVSKSSITHSADAHNCAPLHFSGFLGIFLSIDVHPYRTKPLTRI